MRDKINTVLLSMVAACISIACFAYGWEVYRRYHFERLAEKHCAVYFGLDDLTTEEDKAGAWLRLRRCIVEHTVGLNVNVTVTPE